MKRRAQMFLLLSPLLVVSATALLTIDTPWMRDARFWLDWRNDAAERKVRRYAGFGAVDCGQAAPTTMSLLDGGKGDKNLRKVEGCVLRNYQSHKSFRVTYFYSCTDGCWEIRTWNARRGMMKLRYANGSLHSQEGCANARIAEEEATMPNGDSGTHITIGCPR